MRKRILLFGVLAVLAIAIMFAGTATAGAVKVKGQRLTSKTIEETVTCTGTVVAGGVSAVSTEIGCVINEVLVKEGQSVKAGDVVATVDKSLTKQLQQKRDSDALALVTMPDRLVADADGVVLTVGVTSGAWLESGVPCVTIALREDMRISINIREKQLNDVQKGQSVSVSGAGLRMASYDGVLEEVSSTVVGTSAVVLGTVKLQPGQIDDSFRLGLSAKAKITTRVRENGIVIPHDAVLSDDQGAFVYVVKDNMAIKREITIAEQLAQGVLVTDTSLEREIILTEPHLITAEERVDVVLEETTI